jgi:hypothetical protein
MITVGQVMFTVNDIGDGGFTVILLQPMTARWSRLAPM